MCGSGTVRYAGNANLLHWEASSTFLERSGVGAGRVQSPLQSLTHQKVRCQYMTMLCAKHSLGDSVSEGKTCDPTLAFKGAFRASEILVPSVGAAGAAAIMKK